MALTTVDRWEQVLHRRLSMASCLLSVLLHAGLVALVAWWLQTVPAAPVGFGDEPMREIGIVRESAGQNPVVANEVDPAPPQPTAAPPTEIPFPSSVSPPTTTAAPLEVPSTAGIGVGVSPLSPGAPDARSIVNAARPPSTGAQLDAGLPGAAFLGAKDKGSRIVFVVDCSASMANYHAMRSAKAALASSLNALTDAQQFQIIFYNQTTKPLPPRVRSDGALFFATEVNKTYALQAIGLIEPDLGTDHIPALKLALRMGPEVIFFLTDADEPQLSGAELAEIARINQGRARIHTIEFGKGAELDLDNFLKKLARQNGGTYRYHDVKRLANP